MLEKRDEKVEQKTEKTFAGKTIFMSLEPVGTYVKMAKKKFFISFTNSSLFFT
jgi:hypothetical protein